MNTHKSHMNWVSSLRELTIWMSHELTNENEKWVTNSYLTYEYVTNHIRLGGHVGGDWPYKWVTNSHLLNQSRIIRLSHALACINKSRITYEFGAYHSYVRRCNTLQHTATHCNTLQHTATQGSAQHVWKSHESHMNLGHIIHMYDTATHCNILHHTATHCNTGLGAACMNKSRITHELGAYPSYVRHCNTLQHTATHCNTLQHRALRSMYEYVTNLIQIRGQSGENWPYEWVTNSHLAYGWVTNAHLTYERVTYLRLIHVWDMSSWLIHMWNVSLCGCDIAMWVPHSAHKFVIHSCVRYDSSDEFVTHSYVRYEFVWVSHSACGFVTHLYLRYKFVTHSYPRYAWLHEFVTYSYVRFEFK